MGTWKQILAALAPRAPMRMALGAVLGMKVGALLYERTLGDAGPGMMVAAVACGAVAWAGVAALVRWTEPPATSSDTPPAAE